VRVRFTPRARSDLQSILQYIDARSPQGVQSVKRAIQKTIELVGEFPVGSDPANRRRACCRPAAIRT
jgi:plasmid stabilization system protein ParE